MTYSSSVLLDTVSMIPRQPTHTVVPSFMVSSTPPPAIPGGTICRTRLHQTVRGGRWGDRPRLFHAGYIFLFFPYVFVQVVLAKAFKMAQDTNYIGNTIRRPFVHLFHPAWARICTTAALWTSEWHNTVLNLSGIYGGLYCM